MRTRGTAVWLAVIAVVAISPSVGVREAKIRSTILSVDALQELARQRVRGTARVPLHDPGLAVPSGTLRLQGSTVPHYIQALEGMTHLVGPFARMVDTFLYRGGLPSEVKAAIGLRIAQVNGSPYVAAHTTRLLRSAATGRPLLDALRTNSIAGLAPRNRLGITYAESLTRDVNGVGDAAFAEVRSYYNDSEIVELTLTVSFFNYFTRYAEALRLPVEDWALETPAAPSAPAGAAKARVALISDEEIAATSAAAALASTSTPQGGGLGLGMANSQRAMLRAPELAVAWRAFGTAVREKETVGRDIKLQVSFAVSMANGCRYCTLHQVLGLRRLGVDPGKLVAMKKDDSMLRPRELVAVQFARKLTGVPVEVTNDDYLALRREFGDVGALEVLLQTCNFAFMNRFTDGLRLASEDEAIRVYRETYGTESFRH